MGFIDLVKKTAADTRDFVVNDILGGTVTLAKETARAAATAVALPIVEGVRAGKELITKEKTGAVDLPFIGRIEEFGTEEFTRQATGLFLETAVTALPIGVFGRVSNLSKVSKVKRALAVDSITGAGIGAGVTLRTEPDASVKDIGLAALTGAAVGTLLPRVGGKGLELGLKGLSKTGQLSKTIGKKVETFLQRTAFPETTAKQFDTALDEFIDIGQGAAKKTTKTEKAAQTALKGIESIKNFQEYWTDKFTPLARLEQAAKKNLGRDLELDEQAYLQARLFAGVGGKVENRLDDFAGILTKHAEVKDELRAYLIAQDFIERGKAGLELPRGKTVEEASVALTQLEQRLDPQSLSKIREAAGEIYDFQNQRLRDRVDAGLISEESYFNIINSHKTYIPHDVTDFIDKEAGASFITRKGFSVSESDVKKAKGSQREIDDPMAAIIRRTTTGTVLSERNRVGQTIIDLGRESFPDNFQLLKTAIKDVDIPKGAEKVSIFRNGAKEEWLVPEDIGRVMKNLYPQESGFFMRLLSLPANFLRAGATRLNPSFLLSNLFRDVQTAGTLAKEGLSPNGWVEALVVNTNTSDLYRLYRESGAKGTFSIREGIAPRQVIEQIEKNAIKLPVKEKLGRTIIKILNLKRVIEQTGERIETATRLQVFKKALADGVDPLEAAFSSRNATIDFQRMGSAMETLNKVIPFLNARVQGVINIGKGVKQDPTTFLRRQMYYSVWPTTYLYSHNRNFESFQMIPQAERDTNFILMIGETEGVDENSNIIKIPQYIKIPKGEALLPISVALENFLSFADQQDSREISELFKDIALGISPITTARGSTLASAGGPIPSLIYGTTANKHPYFGTSIIPTSRLKADPELQFNPDYTGELAKKIGGVLNYSPALIQFYLESVGGGLVTDALRGFDYMVKGKLPAKTATGFGQAAVAPITRRFFGERTSDFGTLRQLKQQELKETIERDVTSEKIRNVKDPAKEIYNELNKMDSDEERFNRLTELEEQGILTEDIRKEISRLKNYNSAVESLDKSDSVEVRARYIFNRLAEISSKEERLRFLEDLEQEKILTDSVRERIAELKKQLGYPF